jgi:hypothetical protein
MSTIGGNHTRVYRIWKGMLQRCLLAALARASGEVRAAP